MDFRPKGAAVRVIEIRIMTSLNTHYVRILFALLPKILRYFNEAVHVTEKSERNFIGLPAALSC